MNITARVPRWFPFVVGSILSAIGASWACSRTTEDKPFILKSLHGHVWAAIDNPKSQPSSGSNAGIVIGDNGVVVVDTFASPHAAKELLVDIRRLATQPVRFVVNTHYHLDHVGGNGVFTQIGAVIVGQLNVREWIHRENLRMVADGMAAEHLTMMPEQRASIEALEPPAAVYQNSLDFYLGSRQLQVRSLPGHSGSDSVLVIPDTQIVFTGDLFWRHTMPNTIDASTELWIDTLDGLVKDYPGFTFIGGHGDIGTLKDVVAFRGYLARLRQLVAEAHVKGMSGEAAVPVLLPQLAKQYEQWDYFREVARTNILQMDDELSGRKRIPAAAPPK